MFHTRYSYKYMYITCLATCIHVHTHTHTHTHTHQMSCNQTGCPGITSEVLVLTENETERDRWLATLEELQKAAKQSTEHGVREREGGGVREIGRASGRDSV